MQDGGFATPRDGTADRAEAFIQRQALWQRLTHIFRERRLTNEEMAQVATVAEVSIDKVFSAHRLSPAQQDDRHMIAKDHAECAALYGYALGYARAQAELRGERVA